MTWWSAGHETGERRLKHTRALLLDAAEEVFAEKGFTSATLDDIAHAAGYTKGAIYKNFAEVRQPSWERELDDVAQRWRQLSSDRGAEHAALGHEFTLYLLRNREARERVATKRSEVVEALSTFVAEGLDRMGGALLIPPLTFAQLLVATSDSIVLGSQLDDVDLYRPILEMYASVIKLPGRE